MCGKKRVKQMDKAGWNKSMNIAKGDKNCFTRRRITFL